MSRTTGSYMWQVKKLLRRSKALKIIETSPAGEEEKSRKIFSRGLSGHEIFLIGELRRGRFVRHKGQLEVIDDFIDHGIVSEESDHVHLSAEMR